MAELSTWPTQNSGPTGTNDSREVAVHMAALAMPGVAALKMKQGFRPSGGTSPGIVTATGTPDGFVHVSAFQLFLQNIRGSGLGMYITCNDAQKDINILSTPADPTNARRDLIIAQQSDIFDSDANSNFDVKQVVGTPSGSPVDPTPSGSTNYITLARVTVPANATSINSGNITDLRTSGHSKSLTGGLYAVALGGIEPVASQAERDALTSLYDGFPVWRQDLDRLDIYDGAAFRGVTPWMSRQTLSGSAATVTFSSIPTSLRTLSLRWSARGTDAAATQNILMRINADAGANYDYQYTQGNNVTTSSAQQQGATSALLGNIACAGSGAGIFSCGDVDYMGWDSPHANYLTWQFRHGAMRITGLNNFTTHGAGSYFAVTASYTSIVLSLAAGSFATGSDFQLLGWN